MPRCPALTHIPRQTAFRNVLVEGQLMGAQGCPNRYVPPGFAGGHGGAAGGHGGLALQVCVTLHLVTLSPRHRPPVVTSVKRTMRSCASSASLILLGNFGSSVPTISRFGSMPCCARNCCTLSARSMANERMSSCVKRPCGPGQAALPSILRYRRDERSTGSTCVVRSSVAFWVKRVLSGSKSIFSSGSLTTASALCCSWGESCGRSTRAVSRKVLLVGGWTEKS